MNLQKALTEAFYFRHACKKYDSTRKISAQDFDFILEAGRLSPSSYGGLNRGGCL